MKTPKVTVRSRADEKIVEFTGKDGVGGLIAIRQRDDGTVLVELYRLDAKVFVEAPPDNQATRPWKSPLDVARDIVRMRKARKEPGP